MLLALSHCGLIAHPTENYPSINNVHEHVRNRLENVISKVKSHAFLRNIFAGSFELLSVMVKITGQVTAYELRRFQRFDLFGPWMGSLGVPNK